MWIASDHAGVKFFGGFEEDFEDWGVAGEVGQAVEETVGVSKLCLHDDSCAVLKKKFDLFHLDVFVADKKFC